MKYELKARVESDAVFQDPLLVTHGDYELEFQPDDEGYVVELSARISVVDYSQYLPQQGRWG